ncbi:MAG: recN [Firmicutes bacterium]|nr:recN [Bacillota bacterium]
MLLQLNIKNFALIENLSISFDKGFNVFTGETGAGKSILIDAINYVLGSKFNKDLIRTGESKTCVEAVFTIENDRTCEDLKEMSVEFDDLVIIERETFQSGKSIIKVNGKSVLVSSLKKITSSLLDIHGQHENQNMLDWTSHVQYLDYFGQDKIKAEMDRYRERFEKLTAIRTRINSLSGGSGEDDKLADFILYQINEIRSAKLVPGEEEKLQERASILSNAEKISGTLNGAYSALYEGADDTPSIFDTLGVVIRDLKSIENHHQELKKFTQDIQDIYYSLEGVVEEVRNFKSNIHYDESELEEINNRIFQISALKKKYGKSIEEILRNLEEMTVRFDVMVNRSEILETLRNEEAAMLESAKKQAEVIHRIRCEVSKVLEKRIHKELSFIGLGKSVFKVNVEPSGKLQSNGSDKVQFFISTNPGEPVKPLEKVVSGGELSRIMLALKTIFVDKDKIPSVIFDEIDTGISGRIAQSVSEKMYSISIDHQVFCVTHLPQIASMSDAHYHVSKETKNGKTYTEVALLDKRSKELEIAKMIGSSEVTNITLENARELISMADSKKQELKELP